MEFEAAHQSLSASTADEYKKLIDEWAVSFVKRHLPGFEFSEPVNLIPAFQELHNIGIETHCEQQELIIGVPQIVTYSFTSGDMILAELTLKLSFE